MTDIIPTTDNREIVDLLYTMNLSLKSISETMDDLKPKHDSREDRSDNKITSSLFGFTTGGFIKNINTVKPESLKSVSDFVSSTHSIVKDIINVGVTQYREASNLLSDAVAGMSNFDPNWIEKFGRIGTRTTRIALSGYEQITTRVVDLFIGVGQKIEKNRIAYELGQKHITDKGFSTNIKGVADSTLILAGSVGAFTALSALSGMETLKGLGYMTASIGAIISMTALASKIPSKQLETSSNALLKMTATVGLVSGLAVGASLLTKVVDVKELAIGTAVVGGITLFIGGMALLFSKIGNSKFAESIDKGSSALNQISVSIGLLGLVGGGMALMSKSVGEMEQEKIYKGLGFIGSTFAIFGSLIVGIGSFASKNKGILLAMGATTLVISGTILAISATTKHFAETALGFSSYDQEKLNKGIGMMSWIAGGVTIAITTLGSLVALTGGVGGLVLGAGMAAVAGIIGTIQGLSMVLRYTANTALYFEEVESKLKDKSFVAVGERIAQSVTGTIHTFVDSLSGISLRRLAMSTLKTPLMMTTLIGMNSIVSSMRKSINHFISLEKESGGNISETASRLGGSIATFLDRVIEPIEKITFKSISKMATISDALVGNWFRAGFFTSLSKFLDVISKFGEMKYIERMDGDRPIYKAMTSTPSQFGVIANKMSSGIGMFLENLVRPMELMTKELSGRMKKVASALVGDEYGTVVSWFAIKNPGFLQTVSAIIDLVQNFGERQIDIQKMRKDAHNMAQQIGVFMGSLVEGLEKVNEDHAKKFRSISKKMFTGEASVFRQINELMSSIQRVSELTISEVDASGRKIVKKMTTSDIDRSINLVASITAGFITKIGESFSRLEKYTDPQDRFGEFLDKEHEHLKLIKSYLKGIGKIEGLSAKMLKSAQTVKTNVGETTSAMTNALIGEFSKFIIGIETSTKSYPNKLNAVAEQLSKSVKMIRNISKSISHIVKTFMKLRKNKDFGKFSEIQKEVQQLFSTFRLPMIEIPDTTDTASVIQKIHIPNVKISYDGDNEIYTRLASAYNDMTGRVRMDLNRARTLYSSVNVPDEVLKFRLPSVRVDEIGGEVKENMRYIGNVMETLSDNIPMRLIEQAHFNTESVKKMREIYQEIAIGIENTEKIVRDLKKIKLPKFEYGTELNSIVDSLNKIRYNNKDKSLEYLIDRLKELSKVLKDLPQNVRVGLRVDEQGSFKLSKEDTSKETIQRTTNNTTNVNNTTVSGGRVVSLDRNTLQNLQTIIKDIFNASTSAGKPIIVEFGDDVLRGKLYK